MKERNLALIQGQIALFYAELEGMKAENEQRKHRGESLAYTEGAFNNLYAKYDSVFGYNTILSMDWS